MRPFIELLEDRLVPSSAFVQRVLNDMPQLQNANLNDFQRVSFIREWAYSQVDGADSTEVYLDNAAYDDLSPAQMLDLFDRDVGGVYCGGAATFLMKTYRAFGYESATANGGFPDINSTSHVVTLVRIESKGHTVDSVHDALGNATYTDSAGDPLHFGQIRQYLAGGHTNKIIASAGEIVGRDQLVTDAGKLAYENGYGSKYIWSGSTPPEFTKVRDGVWKFRSDITSELLNEHWLGVKDVPVEKRTIALFSEIIGDITFLPPTDVESVRVVGSVVYGQRHAFAPFPGFSGEINTASGDLNGDGVADIIVSPGFGGGPHVKAFDGQSGELMHSFFAYAPTFTGGVFVAAGDLNGDGFDEIITGAGSGGAPHVRAFEMASGDLLADFFAYSPSFTGGVRVAVGDVNDDGFDDIVTGAGPGGGPHVKAFDGHTHTVLDEFLAGSGSDGVFVDVEEDGSITTR